MVEPETPDALKPLPVQLVVLVEVQLSVADWPGITVFGFAESETVGVVGDGGRVVTRRSQFAALQPVTV